DEREVIVQLARDDLVGRLADRAAEILREQAEFIIDKGGGLFQNPQRADQLARHALASNLKIDQGAGSLTSVVAVHRHLHLPHRVSFNSEFQEDSPVEGNMYVFFGGLSPNAAYDRRALGGESSRRPYCRGKAHAILMHAWYSETAYFQ